MGSQLVELCIESACLSGDSVEKWRRQRRSLERLPSQLAGALLHRLHTRRLLYPSLLEVFKYSIEEINLSGENAVDAEWMAYLGAFRHLRVLNVAGCHRLTSSALWDVTGMTTLKELDLSRCSKVTDTGIRHLTSIPTLEKLWISETGVTAYGVMLLPPLKNLVVLDLGGLPVTDQAMSSLQVLTKLQYLDLWGSKISDNGSSFLQMFTKLSFLNLAWTNVSMFPNLPHLECLNMSNCTITSVLEGNGGKVPLRKLIASGATFSNDTEDLRYIDSSSLSFLDASNTSLQNFTFLPRMKALEYLDLSSTTIGDTSVESIAYIGENLKSLNLSNTRISSFGVGILAGKVPHLETISLAHTPVDDVAISFIGMMPSLKTIDLSNTNIKGFIHRSTAERDPYLSLTALQTLGCLETLNLEHTQIVDLAISPLSSFRNLSYLLLRSFSLTDSALYYLSSLPKLATLSIREAVLTNSALDLFKPPKSLRKIDLSGCWLLTADAILAFGISYPQIKLTHELVHDLPSHPVLSNPSSPARFTAKTSQMNLKTRRVSVSSSFVDQRFKYSRDELLAMRYSSLSIASTHDRVDVIPTDVVCLQLDP